MKCIRRKKTKKEKKITISHRVIINIKLKLKKEKKFWQVKKTMSIRFYTETVTWVLFLGQKQKMGKNCRNNVNALNYKEILLNLV